jgi:hypothetical protein
MFGQEARLSPRFRTVYILEMSNALDQHLASRLSNAGVFWVVLEPKNADAVITDSLDDAFWTWMQRNYPRPGAAPAAAPDPPRGIPGISLRRDIPPAGRQRGTIFLVDPRNRVVLWSTYELPRNSSPTELDHSTNRITNQIKAAFAKK